jgi:hypothetical protein
LQKTPGGQKNIILSSSMAKNMPKIAELKLRISEKIAIAELRLRAAVLLFIYFGSGSGSYFDLNFYSGFGSELFKKNIFEMHII